MRPSPFRALTLVALSALLFGTASASAAPTITLASISRVFDQVALSPYLSDPSMILIDRMSGEVMFEKDAKSLRRPASVMKILSATAVLQYLAPDYRYVTKLALGNTPATIIMSGAFDPWMTGNYKSALREHRAWLPYLVNKTIATLESDQPGTKVITVKQVGLFSGDVTYLTGYFKKKGITAKFSAIKASQVPLATLREIASTTSPSITTMVKFALTWSDNLLAERLVRAASRSAGFSNDDFGVSDTIHKMLETLQIDSSGLDVRDGSGLSKEDRVNVRLIANLLIKIRNDQKFAAIYEGLPVSGESGTLLSRFIKTAPQAVGLVRAKTGTLNGTVSLAGYVESGDREYIFVAIADRIKKGSLATDRARSTLDRLLGKITSPLLVGLPESSPSPSPSPTFSTSPKVEPSQSPSASPEALSLSE